MTARIALPTFAIGYYVVDEVGHVGALSGPFLTYADAERDLRDYNIAGDCGVWHRDANGQMRPCAGYGLHHD